MLPTDREQRTPHNDDARVKCYSLLRRQPVSVTDAHVHLHAHTLRCSRPISQTPGLSPLETQDAAPKETVTPFLASAYKYSVIRSNQKLDTKSKPLQGDGEMGGTSL